MTVAGAVLADQVVEAIGLLRSELTALDDEQLGTLTAWHRTVSGDNDGRPWWPAAIRRMPLEERLRLAYDPALDQIWKDRELQRVKRSVLYFTASYGFVQPEVGEPIPFDLWPEQLDVIRAFVRHLRVVVLKARQLGLTWLALHYAIHMLCFDPAHPNAKILALSKHGGDASKLMQRGKRIVSLLPPYLRPKEDVSSRRSVSRLSITGRGEMISLAGTPSAARSETASLALVDEFAHIRNKLAQPTWTALEPTLGSRGKAIVIFTGNGPAEAPGDGQAAARIWQKSQTGEKDALGFAFHGIFLPSHVHPDRDEAWHEAKRGEYLTDQEFRAEYPENEEEALAGPQGKKVYDPEGINAAERLGREFDDLLDRNRMPEPSIIHPWGDPVLITCTDWGELTHMLIAWPLEGGGFYFCAEVAPERPQAPELSTKALMDVALSEIQVELDDGTIWPPFGDARYDAAGVQSQRTFEQTIRTGGVGPGEEPTSEYMRQWLPFKDPTPRNPTGLIHQVGVPFGEKVGRGSYKNLGRDYLKRLFLRTKEGNLSQIIAISPRRCPVFLRQLRGLEVVDDESGRIAKGADHGPDAAIAGVAPTARLVIGAQVQ